MDPVEARDFWEAEDASMVVVLWGLRDDLGMACKVVVAAATVVLAWGDVFGSG